LAASAEVGFVLGLDVEESSEDDDVVDEEVVDEAVEDGVVVEDVGEDDEADETRELGEVECATGSLSLEDKTAVCSFSLGWAGLSLTS
jgi:hypothetical protein